MISSIGEGRARSQTRAIVLVAFAALFAVAAFVVFLPPAVYAPVPQPATSSKLDVQAPAVSTATTTEAATSVVQDLMATALRRLVQLENDGVRRWGLDPIDGVSIGAIDGHLREANSLADRRHYAAAAGAYRETTAAMEKLHASKAGRLQAAIDGARAAFNALNSSVAVEKYEIARALAPHDAMISSELDRARKLPDVLARLAKAREAEDARDARMALRLYEEAATLDLQNDLAKTGVQRLHRMVADLDYKAAISEVLRHLSKGTDLRAAEAALERARKINPQGAEISDLQRQVRSATQVRAVELLRTQIADLERMEKWSDAIKVYDQLLKAEGGSASAAGGRARARLFEEWHSAIDLYIAQPARLQSPDPQAHARLLLDTTAMHGEGELLFAKRRQLVALLAAAQKPIVVIIRSDKFTDVNLNRLGKLGNFDSRQVELPPGRYVATGTRSGFRDVRVQFEVLASTPAIQITVVCTEPLR